MLFKRLHNNSLITVIVTPILIVLLWLRLFVSELSSNTVINNPAMPLWSNYLEPWFGTTQFTAALTSLILVVLSGLALNKIVNRNMLLLSQSMITMFIFSLLISAYLSVQKLNPQLFFLFIMIHSIGRLLGDVNNRKIELRHFFDSAFLLGIGTLIYLKGAFFYPALIIVMGILRVLNLRTLMVSIVGFLLPYFLSFTYLFYTDQLLWFLSEMHDNILANPGEYNHTLYSQVFMGAVIFFIALSLISKMRRLSIRKINVRLYFRIFIWLLLYTTALVLTSFFSIEILPMAVIGASVLLASFFETIERRFLRELLFIALVALSIVGQFLLI